jgi:hypothetical protein
MLFDTRGRLHVLHQSGPARFTHSSFSSRGTPLDKQFISADGSNVRLVRTPEGGVEVVGGRVYEGDPYVREREYIEPGLFE